MDKRKKTKLEKAGWKVGTASDFLELSPEDAMYVELKVSLSQYLKKLRTQNHLTQGELAKRIKSSQSRIAKMESGDPSVSIDLLIRSLFALGSTQRDIVKALA